MIKISPTLIFFSLKGKSFIQADEDDEGYFGRGQTFVVEDKYLQLFQIFLCVLMAFFTLTVMQCTSTLRNDLNNIGCPSLSGPQFTIILAIVLGLMKISCPQRNTTYLYFFNENVRELHYQHVFSRHSYLNI